MAEQAGDVLVIGGGIIGLSIAWRLAKGEARVTVLDPAPGSGASRAAAGMLAAVTEAHYGEEELLALNLESSRLWPSFATELEQASGEPLGYDSSGTLAIAYDPSDRAALEELHRFQQSLGLESTTLAASACRNLEPALAPGIRGGLDVPSDHQVDPRKVVAALETACGLAGVRLEKVSAEHITIAGGRVASVRSAEGDEMSAGRYVLAAGWQSARLAGLPPEARPPLRPVKGQILRLRLDERLPRPSRTLRAVVRGNTVYLVPRGSGEIVCGATVEEMGTDARVTAGAVYSLLRDAQAIVPALYEAELVECLAGFRPGTPDNVPLIGETAVEGLFMAAGHYRNGVLLAPVTAEIVASLLLEQEAGGLPSYPAADPRRFAPEAA